MFRREHFFIIFSVFTVHNHIQQRWINIGEMSVRLLVSIVYLFFLTTCMTDPTYDFSLSLSLLLFPVSLHLCNLHTYVLAHIHTQLRISVLSPLISFFSLVSRFAFHCCPVAITSATITNII